jgi:RNA polymerase sigma factor (sigma-70 family)
VRHRAPAWEADYCEYFHARQKAFMRTAYAMLGSWPAAEDAAQTTFTQLYVYWPKIRGGVDPYARRILVNACMASFRSGRHETVTELLPETEALNDPAERLDLHTALRRLSIKDRAVLTLRFLDDLPVAEVAEILQIPVGTAKSQTSRALTRLACVLAPTPAKEST